MKLRIKGDSIRFRLLRSEVERFAAHGKIAEEVRFGPEGSAALKWGIMSSANVDRVESQFEYYEILVLIPELTARDWIESEVVGISGKQDIGGGRVLDVLIEKDFECIGRPDDPDRADAYPNPDLTCTTEADG